MITGISVEALNKIKANAGEHFDDYLIVLIKGQDVYTSYKSKVAAMGMATMIREDIKQDWKKGND